MSGEVLMVSWQEIEEMSAVELALYVGSVKFAAEQVEVATVSPTIGLAFVEARLLLVEKVVTMLRADRERYSKADLHQMRTKLKEEKRDLKRQQNEMKKLVRLKRN